MKKREYERQPYLSEASKTGVGRLANLLVRVGENLREARKNGGKGDRELARSKESHGPHELNSTLLSPPLLLVETLEESGENELDGVSTQPSHDGLGSILSRFTNLARRVAEASEEKREDLGDVGLEESAEDRRKDLVSEDGTLPRLNALLVLGVVAKASENAELLKRRDTATANDTGESVSCSATLGVLGRVEHVVEELINQLGNVVLDDLDERRKTVADSGLNDLGGRAKGLDETSDDGLDARVGRLEVTGETSKENDETLDNVVLRLGAGAGTAEVLLESGD